MNKRTASGFGFLAVLVTMIASTSPLGAAIGASASAAIGDWEGKIDARGSSLRVIVHISQAEDGKLTGSPCSSSTGVTASGNEAQHFLI